MSGALRAEWTKLVTLPSARWLVAATTTSLVVVGAAVAAALDVRPCRDETACAVDPTRASLGGVWVAQIAVVTLAVLAVSSEYETGQIHVTLAAMPRRLTVLAAKSCVVVALVLAASSLGAVGALAAGRTVLTHNDFVRTAGHPPLPFAPSLTAQAVAGTALYLAIVALLAIGVAACLRDTAASIVLVLSGLLLFPLLGVVIGDRTWHRRLERYAPMSAGLAVQATRRLDDLTIGAWRGLGVLFAYGAVAWAAGAGALASRDA